MIQAIVIPFIVPFLDAGLSKRYNAKTGLSGDLKIKKKLRLPDGSYRICNVERSRQGEYEGVSHGN
jgi:hypothetical protein